MSNSFFHISELCQQANCTLETIRYYEKISLLPKPLRAENGYRLYTQDNLTLLRFIQACRGMGFSVDETFQLIQLRNNPDENCQNAAQLVQHHLEQVNRKIDHLIEIKAFLEKLSDCKEQKAMKCKVIHGLKER